MVKKKLVKKSAKSVPAPPAPASPVEEPSIENQSIEKPSKKSSKKAGNKGKTNKKSEKSSSSVPTVAEDGFTSLLISGDESGKYTRTLLLKDHKDDDISALFATHIDNLSESQLRAIFSSFGFGVEGVLVKNVVRRACHDLKLEGIGVEESAFAVIEFQSQEQVDAVLSRAKDSTKHPIFVPEIKPEPVLRKTLLSLKRSYYPDPEKLQQFYDDFMSKYEEETRDKLKREELAASLPDDDGFITVKAGGKNSFKQEVPKHIIKAREAREKEEQTGDSSSKSSKKRARNGGLIDYDGAHSGITATMLRASGTGAGAGGVDDLLQNTEQGRKMAALLGVEDEAAFLSRKKRKKENKGISNNMYAFQQSEQRKQDLVREAKRLEKDEKRAEERMKLKLK